LSPFIKENVGFTTNVICAHCSYSCLEQGSLTQVCQTGWRCELYWYKSGMHMSCWWLFTLICGLGSGIRSTRCLMLISTSEVGIGCQRWWSCAETGVMLPSTFMASVSWLTGSRFVASQAVKTEFPSLDDSPPFLTVGYHIAVVCLVRALTICTFPLCSWWSKSWRVWWLPFSLSEKWVGDCRGNSCRSTLWRMCVRLLPGFEFLWGWIPLTVGTSIQDHRGRKLNLFAYQRVTLPEQLERGDPHKSHETVREILILLHDFPWCHRIVASLRVHRQGMKRIRDWIPTPTWSTEDPYQSLYIPQTVFKLPSVTHF